MADRTLPEGRNPLLEEDNAPPYDILVERRCLGQTELKVKPGQVGTTNATKPDNLGTLDYAHLRVPLPKDLTDSGIFHKQGNRKYPEAYFLMRRSTDGFISATGMFKAAFPWAQPEDEHAEKEYMKSLETTSSEEVAGNVWIHPDQALTLSDEYGIRVWVEALLDPESITHGTSDPKKGIKSPPAYRMRNMMNGSSKSPEPKKAAGDGRRSTRGKGSTARSESPVKKTPARKMATPRKPRKGRGQSTEPDAEANGEALAQQHENETVKVEVETERLPAMDEEEEEIERTKVHVEMPMHHPDLDLPSDAQEMLEKAREMVAEAQAIDGRRTSTPRSKRKASDVLDDEDLDMLPTAKRAKKVELELRRERIKRRALTGIAASLALGAIIPNVIAFFAS